MEWSVLVRLPLREADDPAAVEAVVDRVGDVLEDLEPFSAALSVGNGTIGAQAAVEAPTAGAAVQVVRAALRKACAAHGVRVRDEVVEQHVQRWAEFEAAVNASDFPDLVSGPEAAQILGVTRQRLHQLATEHPDFPPPAYELGAGKLWLQVSIETFARGWARRPGRPPRQVDPVR